MVFSQSNELLDAHIAKDGQWRFPSADSIPEKFKTCIRYFEDEYFYQHPGVNPVSISKAFYSNIFTDKRKRGGSTLTQQVIRLSRQNPPRTVWEKMKEAAMALRLETKFSKEEILNLYATHAPYGSNVVGLEAASWRYFGRTPFQLSWAETATLAVLPNAPSLIYPGKNQERLIKKRNFLLKKLYQNGVLDSTSYELSLSEVIPDQMYTLPHACSHFLNHLIQTQGEGKRYQSTLSSSVQDKISHIGQFHQSRLSDNQINNAAIIVLDIESMEVIGYLGNTSNLKIHAKDVDLIQSARSSGSILKPFLYYHLLAAGKITPEMLVKDIPTTYGNYRPKNFSRGFDGLVKANHALAMSLNVPAVRLLKEYGTEQFLNDLRATGFSTLNYSADHYGLSLILGGGEVNLFETTRGYAYLAQALLGDSLKPLKLIQNDLNEAQVNPYNAMAVYQTFQALLKVNRPNEEEGWEMFESLQNISWKTGTSFGHRDAWAVGLNKKYLVGVWVGNADGEGRPAITGVKTAAPIMFDVFRKMNYHQWFDGNHMNGEKVSLCKKSGFPNGEYCSDTVNVRVATIHIQTGTCPYHQMIYLDEEKQHLVNSSCYEMEKMQKDTLFVIPPICASYYRRKNTDYVPLPSLLASCQNGGENKEVDIVYPIHGSRLKIPKELNGNKGEIVFVAAHQNHQMKLHWHIDGEYIETTSNQHHISVQPETGPHRLYVLDDLGNEKSIDFYID